MSRAIQEVRLRRGEERTGYPPPDPVGSLMRQMPAVAAMAVRMSFTGRSTSRGPRPDWLRAMADIRFVEAVGGDETVVRFDVPRVGEAAGRQYQELELWRSRPDPGDTAFDLFGDIVAEVGRRETDSDLIDPPILKAISRFGDVIDGYFEELAVAGSRDAAPPVALLTRSTIATARDLREATPAPVRARVVGTLDMIRASSGSFALRLRDGLEVRGALPGGNIVPLRQLLGEEVLALGTAVFRASGTVLRIDAERVTRAEGEAAIWSRMPVPRERKLDRQGLHKPQGARSGMAAIRGQWPGEESDEDYCDALRRIS